MKQIIELPKIDISKSFKKQWEDIDFRRIKLAIRTHFGRNGALTLHNGLKVFQTFADLDNCFGLAYTSSSAYEMFSICNTEVYLDIQRKFSYNHFAMDGNGKCYGILWDKDENEIIIPL